MISEEKCGGTQQIAVTPSCQSGLIIVTLLLTRTRCPVPTTGGPHIEQGAIKQLNRNTTLKYWQKHGRRAWVMWIVFTEHMWVPFILSLVEVEGTPLILITTTTHHTFQD